MNLCRHRNAQGEDVCLSEEHLESKYDHLEGSKGLDCGWSWWLATGLAWHWRGNHEGQAFLSSPPPALQLLPSWQQPGSASVMHLGVQPRREWEGALLQLLAKLDESSAAAQNLPALCCQQDLHGNHPAGSWEDGVWDVIPYTVIPSIPSVGAEEAAAPWGVLLCSADPGQDGWRDEIIARKCLFFPTGISVLVWSADTAAC